MKRTPSRLRQMIASLVVLIFSLGQVACVQSVAGFSTRAPYPQECAPSVQARLPLLSWAKHLVTPVTLNGQTVNLVVDTGTQITTLTPELATALRLPVSLSQRYRTISIGDGPVGTAKFKRIVASLSLGPMEWRDRAVGVDQILHDRQRGQPTSPGGLLGADVMSEYDVELDFAARTMTFYRINIGNDCPAEFAPWRGKYATFPSGHLTERHIFVIPVSVNGHPVRALLDTGSMVTVMARAAALEAGVTAAALDNDRLLSGLQSAGSTYEARLHTFDTIEMGDTRFSPVTIQVVDRPLPDVDMLLGMDLLKNQRIWLSHGTDQVFMQRAEPPPARQAP